MYACGLRIHEAAALAIPAIDSTCRTLRIIGKGDKERHVPVPLPVLEELRIIWKGHRHPHWLFPNKTRSNHINKSVLARTFSAAAYEAGLRPKPTPHTLRHSYATRLLENGVDTRVVQILLGHASIKSTAIYTHLTEPTRERLRGILDILMAGL